MELICLEWADFSQLDVWLDEAAALQEDYGMPGGELASRFTASMFGALMFRRPQDPAIHRWADRLLHLIETSPDPIERIVLGCNQQIHHTVGVRNDFSMPALISPDEAARAMLDGIAAGQFVLHFPRRFTVWMKLLRLLPYRAYFPIVHRATGL